MLPSSAIVRRKMQYTNNLSLPRYMFDWLILDEYAHNIDPYTISCTTLMKPIRALALGIRHQDILQQDAYDNVAARLGDAIHDSMSKVVTPGVIKETRVARQIMVGDKTYTITGKFDILVQNQDDTWTLRDIKTTSVWAYIYGGKDEDYRIQLSIYRWLLSIEKIVQDIGYIDFFFTDWQKSKAEQDDQYPQQRLKPGYQIKLLSLEETEAYILSRLELLEASKSILDNNLPLCSKEELWATDEVFAVKKHGAKKATKLCDSMNEAQEYISIKSIDGFIERRPPRAKRCAYCSCTQVCNQFKDLQKSGLLA